MKQTMTVFMDYVAAFEQAYADDDWSRLTPFFSEDATYQVKGGPLACEISGRDEILSGLKKSVDGLDKRCTDRKLELTDGPNTVAVGDAHEVSIGWLASYHYGDAPQLFLPGRSVFKIAGDVITAMRDEYDETEMEAVGDWMLKYGEGLDGSYV